MGNEKSAAMPSFDDRIQAYILLFLKLSVVGAIGLSLYYRELGALLYSLLTFWLMQLPKIIESKVKIVLPIEYDVVLVVFMYAAVFLGKVGGAYERFWWWDAVLHTCSGFILSFIAFLVLYIMVQNNKIKAGRLLIGIGIFSFGLALGAIWEIFEFAIDVISNGNLQRGSLRDTMWDLIVDSMGAFVMAWLGGRLIFGKRKNGWITRLTNNFIAANPALRDTK